MSRDNRFLRQIARKKIQNEPKVMAMDIKNDGVKQHLPYDVKFFNNYFRFPCGSFVDQR